MTITAKLRIALAASLAGFAMTACSEAPPPLPELPGLYPAAAQWRPYCFGNHRLDLPKAWLVPDRVADDRKGYGFVSPDAADESSGDGSLQFGLVQFGEARMFEEPDFRKQYVEDANRYYRVQLKEEYADYHRAESYPKEVNELRAASPKGGYAWRVQGKFVSTTWSPLDKRPRIATGAMSEHPDLDMGSAELASQILGAFWPRYRPRTPDEMPTEPGACTPYGLVRPAKGERASGDFDAYLPFRDPKHPALLFWIGIGQPLASSAGKTIDEAPHPWKETPEEAKQRRDESKRRGDWITINPSSDIFVERDYPPEYLTVAGQRARLLVTVLKPRYAKVAYEMQINTQGVAGDPRQPRIAIWVEARKAGYYRDLEGKPAAPPPEQVLPVLKKIATSLTLREEAFAN